MVIVINYLVIDGCKARNNILNQSMIVNQIYSIYNASKSMDTTMGTTPLNIRSYKVYVETQFPHTAIDSAPHIRAKVTGLIGTPSSMASRANINPDPSVPPPLR